MTALRPFRRPGLWLAVWALMAAAVAIGSLLPASDVPGWTFPGADKAQHALGYAALAAYAVMLFATRGAHWRAASALLLYGIGIEAAQGWLTASRSADALDVVANAAGIAAGLALRRTRAAGWLLWLDGTANRT